MRRSRWWPGTLLVLLLPLACRGEPRSAMTAERLGELVDSLQSAVEAAVGLPFTDPVHSELTTTEAVQAYLLDRLMRDFPPERMEGVQGAYRLLGLLPDSLDLEKLLLDLYSEQVAGYYDPERETLYAIETANPSQLRLIMAHEMVHALQDQYLPLDSLMVLGGNGDVVAATQAVLEGHATVASIRVLTPTDDVVSTAGFWETYRQQVRAQQRQMAIFASAPLVLREALIFPYLEGAAFMQWWSENRSTPLPRPEELPVSSEQVLHPDRYVGWDTPVVLVFQDSSSEVLHEDTLGELEIQILLASMRGADEATYDQPIGWGGDRYRVYRSPDGIALIWYSVWEGAPQADRAYRHFREGFAPLPADYRTVVERVRIDGQEGVLVMRAPGGWAGWVARPKVSVRETP